MTLLIIGVALLILLFAIGFYRWNAIQKKLRQGDPVLQMLSRHQQRPGKWEPK